MIDKAVAILVRHGQTEWNREERFRGRADIPLNDNGVRQAEAIADRLARHYSLDAVYSSPLQRAWQTADPIAATVGLVVQALPGLSDIDFGAWEGLSPREAERRDPELFAAWLTSPHLVRMPGGESLEDVSSRAFAAFVEALDRHPFGTVVFVSHRVVCKVLACACLGLSNAHFWRIDQDNAAINVFRYGQDGFFSTVALNDTCHLQGL